MESRVFDNQKFVDLIILTLVLFVAIFLIERSGVLQSLERSLLDTQFRTFQREDPNDNIAIISIDEKSLNQFAQNRVYWPWPREFYQVVLDYLSQQGAEAVVFDILFDTPDFDRINVNGTASDNRFARALEQAGNGVLGLKTTPALDSIVAGPDTSLFSINVEGPWPDTTLQTYLSLPISKFRNAASALGNTSVQGDQDGVIRRLHFFNQTSDGEAVPSLAMATYLMLQPDSTTAEWNPSLGRLRVGDRSIPIQQDGSTLINWYEKGGVQAGTFPYYSFGDVMQSALARLQPFGNAILPDTTFQDKIVFIGASAAGLADIKSTPLSSLEDFPGMEIMATSLNNLLDGNFIEHPTPLGSLGLALLIIVIMVSLTAQFSPLKGTLFSAGFLIIVILVEAILFIQTRYWLPLGLFLTTGFLSYTASLGYRYFTEERDKIQLKLAFNQYVQPELVEQIINNRDQLKLGGEKKELSIMFSDLTAFTSMSENMAAEDLVLLMNDYLGEMSEIIFEHDGTIDKFIGDAIMAFWGAPLPQKKHAIHACRASLHMKRRLYKLNERLKGTNKPELKARFGVNTGEVVVGNIGSKERFNYTAIGDPVNMAARLEPLNALFDTDILIAENTFTELQDEFVCRQAGRFIVKGSTKPMIVFELIADRVHENTAGLEDPLLYYREGLRLYYNRKWKEAKERFEKVLESNPNDGLSTAYVDYCRQYMKYPPDEDWDGTFRMMHK